jgi:hypothetical protein
VQYQVKRGKIYLEKGQEIVQLLLLGAMIEAHATRIEEDTDKTDAEEIIWHINRARVLRQRTSVS